MPVVFSVALLTPRCCSGGPSRRRLRPAPACRSRCPRWTMLPLPSWKARQGEGRRRGVRPSSSSRCRPAPGSGSRCPGGHRAPPRVVDVRAGCSAAGTSVKAPPATLPLHLVVASRPCRPWPGRPVEPHRDRAAARRHGRASAWPSSACRGAVGAAGAARVHAVAGEDDRLVRGVRGVVDEADRRRPGAHGRRARRYTPTVSEAPGSERRRQGHRGEREVPGLAPAR